MASRNAGGLQTSPEEVAFRWNGLSEWMARGLTYWWFDHNWGFSIPPPFVNTSVTSHVWDGLDNAAWGSHVYFNAVHQYDKRFRDPAGDDFYGGRPMTLTKFGLPDWRPNLPSTFHQESPAQHRVRLHSNNLCIVLSATCFFVCNVFVVLLAPYF